MGIRRVANSLANRGTDKAEFRIGVNQDTNTNAPGPLARIEIACYEAPRKANSTLSVAGPVRPAKRRYIPSMIAFNAALGRIAAAHLSSSGK
jgi:hypothetical protein